VNCPYCENPEAHGVLPARDITFERSGLDHGGDYGTLTQVVSTVHPVLDSNRPVKSVRCWNDVHHLERQALFSEQSAERKAREEQRITEFQAETLQAPVAEPTK